MVLNKHSCPLGEFHSLQFYERYLLVGICLRTPEAIKIGSLFSEKVELVNQMLSNFGYSHCVTLRFLALYGLYSHAGALIDYSLLYIGFLDFEAALLLTI